MTLLVMMEMLAIYGHAIFLEVVAPTKSRVVMMEFTAL
jgi:hypothetical protein